MATETSLLDNVAINGTSNKTLKNRKLGLQFGMGMFIVLSMFAVTDKVNAWNGDSDIYRVVSGRGNLTLTLMSLCCAWYAIISNKKDENDKKRKQVADELAAKLSSVAEKNGIIFDWYDDESKIMATEYFLNFMTGAERNNLKNKFNVMLQKTEESQNKTKKQQQKARKAHKKDKNQNQKPEEPQQQTEDPKKAFLEYLLQVVNDVMAREQGLDKIVAGIAAGKTAVWANAVQRTYGC